MPRADFVNEVVEIMGRTVAQAEILFERIATFRTTDAEGHTIA